MGKEDKKAKQIEQSIRNAEASLKVEGLHVTDEDRKLLMKYINGEITRNEYIEKCVELVNE
ncbi:hypothetical protein BHF71_05755 [Vulcanibacillus modesticaldus]|uniref:Antitoxin VbhA domain-containing protein n=1 Tax=Vulcanibacillus modesticaldus TaxID=337097 RepID=A0A1D2YWZ5_9BACI|nr:antitoxin VbhA family protein [Vulcanibacillus modesticaldus]OEG00192.1 hypothetical protein BHF71_05755 [Vulcanibacillus modesticaldus]